MSDSEEREPTREEFMKAHMRFAEVMASVQYDCLYGNPRKARETALAWVGVIQLSTMGSVAGYTRGCFGQPYAPPRIAVAAAAPGLDMKACDFHVRLVKAHEQFRVLDDHMGFVQGQVDEATYKNDPQERRTKIAIFAEDHVHVFWHDLGRIFPDPDSVPPTSFRLWKLGDDREHEIERLGTAVMRVCNSEADAKTWVEARSAELRVLHDKNHARQCKDKACAKRGHTYEPSYDDD